MDLATVCNTGHMEKHGSKMKTRNRMEKEMETWPLSCCCPSKIRLLLATHS